MSDLETQTLIRRVIAEGHALDVGMELLMVGQPENGCDSARVTLHRAGVRWHPVAFEFRTRPATFQANEVMHAVAEARRETAGRCMAIIESVKNARRRGKHIDRAIVITCEAIARRINEEIMPASGPVATCNAPLMNGGTCQLPRGHRNDSPVIHP